MRQVVIGILAVGFLSLSGCSSQEPQTIVSKNKSGTVSAPPSMDDVFVSKASGKARFLLPLRLSSQDANQNRYQKNKAEPKEIYGETIDGTDYIRIEGLVSEASFQAIQTGLAEQSEQRFGARSGVLGAAMQTELLAAEWKVLGSQLEDKVSLRDGSFYNSVGYFQGLIPLKVAQKLSAVKGLGANVLVNPVLVDGQVSLKEPMDAGLAQNILQGLTSDAGKRELANMSGLKTLKVPEFLAKVEKEIGETPDGSQVTVGIVDTGITLAHPSFMDDQGNTRIVRIKEFTNEGVAYIHPESNLKLDFRKHNEEDFLAAFTADVLPPAQNQQAGPPADSLREIRGEMLLSSEQAEDLRLLDVQAQLGVISEDLLSGPRDPVDLNQNGSQKDLYFILYIQKGNDSYAYLSFISEDGKPDFRKSPKLSDYNANQEAMKIGSERVGLEFGKAKIRTKSGGELEATTVAMVGYDPGNHGSHVAGIVGGRKTISNDADTTLARGVAPAAKLMMNRVCSNNFGCSSTPAVVDLAENGAEIINMSLGGLNPFNDGYSVGEITINRLVTQHDVMFVISAGNSGPGMNTVGSPSTARLALSVGATANAAMVQAQYQNLGNALGPKTADENFMLYFSSRGPSGAGGFKPNISAPGTELSAIQLNHANTQQGGLAVYWGTSMSAPAATGAIALLKDAAKRYNMQDDREPLPIDAQTLRFVLMESAKPFAQASFDPDTGKVSKGEYTWADQGAGMLQLDRAWDLLKKQSGLAVELPTAVNDEADGASQPVELDYEVRVKQTYRNGFEYFGKKLEGPVGDVVGNMFGRGLWIDPNDDRSLFSIEIARRLPARYVGKEQYFDLRTQLLTSKDEFVLKKQYYGSEGRKLDWLKVGVRQQLPCLKSPEQNLLVVGLGSKDAEDDGPKPGLLRDSALNVCLDRKKLATAKAGEHGALIKGYRTVDGKVSAIPSFIVPVFMQIPHKVLAGSKGFETSGSVGSLQVKRHFVEVPKGTSLLKVVLELPEAELKDGRVAGCSGVQLNVLEGNNSAKPPEFAGDMRYDAIARSCNIQGGLDGANRTVTIIRSNPTPGTWDVHIFGRPIFAQSSYKLSVEYSRIDASKKEVQGDLAALNGTIDMKVEEASLDVTPDAEKSTYTLSALYQESKEKIAEKQRVIVTRPDKSKARSYKENVESVVVSIGGSAGNDLDLSVHSCDDSTLENCVLVGESTTPTDVESVQFEPDPRRVYYAEVAGFTVNKFGGAYLFSETQNLKDREEGTVEVNAISEKTFTVNYGLELEKLSELAEFKSGQFGLAGTIDLKTALGEPLVSIPVRVQASLKDRK